MNFLELKIAGLWESKNRGFFISSVALAILPLPPTLQFFSLLVQRGRVSDYPRASMNVKGF